VSATTTPPQRRLQRGTTYSTGGEAIAHFDRYNEACGRAAVVAQVSRLLRQHQSGTVRIEFADGTAFEIEVRRSEPR
jgi:hypothetical protein